MLTNFSCDDDNNDSAAYYSYINHPKKQVIPIIEQESKEIKFQNNIPIPVYNPDVIKTQTMRSMGWIPGGQGLPREDSNQPFNATLYKASIGNNPTVNTALYQILPQQPWDIDNSALCTASSSAEKQFISGYSSPPSSSSSSSKKNESRGERSGWNVLSESDYAKRQQTLTPEIQARSDAARMTADNRLQDRRLLTQSVSRQGPREGSAFGSSAVPLGYEKLVFPTTDAPEGLDSCQDPAMDEADTLGFSQANTSMPKWTQQEMGPIPPTPEDTGQFPYQGNNRFLASHTDKTTGQTYMVFGRDPMLDNAGKVYDEIPARQIGKASRRLEEMTGNRRLSSPMPNRSEVPNQLVIPDKQGLARAVHEGERMNAEKRIAKSNFFNRDNGVRPPPPEAARTETGAPYTGFVGIREMARYNNVNEASMKEPEFALRKYDTRIAPQTHVKVRNDTVAATRQIFEVAGANASTHANEIDPLGTSVQFTSPLQSNQLKARDISQEGGNSFNDRAILKTGMFSSANNLNSLPAQDYLGGHDYEMQTRTNLVSGYAVSNLSSQVLGDREVSADYDMNTYNRLETNISAQNFASSIDNPLLNDSMNMQNTYNRIETNISTGGPANFSKIDNPLLNDSMNVQNTYNRVETNISAAPGNFTQLPNIDNFIPKDDIQWYTSLAYKGGNVFNASQLPATDLLTDQSFINPNLGLQTNLVSKVSDSSMIYEKNNELNQFLNPSMGLQTNISVPMNGNVLPDRQYEEKNAEIAMNINHSFTPTFGYGGVNTAYTTPLLTDNDKVNNDRIIPYDYQAFSKRNHELVDAHREFDGQVPANVRIPQYDNPTYLLGLRIDSEMKAAKYKDAEASTMLLRAEVGNQQAQMFEEYSKRRMERKSQPKKKKLNYESDTDTDCDVSV